MSKKKIKDPHDAVTLLADNLNKLVHPGGQVMRLVMFDNESEAVTRLKRQIAEAIVSTLIKNGFMEDSE